MERSLADLVRAAERHGERPFFSFVPAGAPGPVETTTFAGYADASLRVATELERIGIGPGTRLGLIGRPDPGFVAALGAGLLLGATLLPVNRLLTAREIAAYLGRARCEYVYADASTAARVAAARPALPALRDVVTVDDLPGTCRIGLDAPRIGRRPVDPDGPGVVLHTSGTTSQPKAVLHTHRHYLAFLRRWADWVIGPDDRVLSYAPYHHLSGLLQNFLAALAVGAPLTQLDTFSARAFWGQVRQARATVTFFIPPVASFLVASPPSPQDREHPLTHSVLAGRSDHWRAFQDRFGVAGHSGYASTETLVCSLTGTRRSPPVAAARLAEPGLLAGTTFDGWAQIRVVDDEDQAVDTGHAGHIQVRGPAVFHGYLDDAAATAGAFTDDGWFRTGDSGYVHHSGDLYLLERTGELIRRSSELISPTEIESVLLDHPAILEAAVVGVADPLREQEIRACVVPVPGSALTTADVFAHAASALAPFKVPRYVEFRDALPRTATFKIRRKQLVDEADPARWTDRLGQHTAAEARRPSISAGP